MKLQLSLLFFVLNISIFSQNPKVFFQSIQHGLSNKQINCILKDSKGYMWFGTPNGLNKYDGTNFTVYENSPIDSASLSHNNINAIIEDQHNNIWIGTLDGLNLYNREKENFIRIKDGGNVHIITSLCADDDIIWIGTSGGGLIRYDPGKSKFEYYRNNEVDINTINSNFISCILKDGKNKLWIGAWNGLDLLKIGENKIEHIEYEGNNSENIRSNHVNTLNIDNNGELWIGTLDGGLNRLSKINNKYSIKQYPLFDNSGKYQIFNILSLSTDKYNNLWIGTENRGLNCLHINSGKMINYFPDEGNPQSISSVTIRSLYMDDIGILWIGTYNRGLNLVDERYNRFETYRKNISSKFTLNGNDVRSFAEDKHGNVWIATDVGICRFNVVSRQFTKSITLGKNGLSVNATTAIVFDVNENLWVGTWDGGIDRFNKKLLKTVNYQIRGPKKTGDNKISCLYQDRQNNIWAGTVGSGLFIYNKRSDSFVQVVDASPSPEPNFPSFITSIKEDSENNIWVGTMYGLFHLKRTNNNKFLFEVFYQNNTNGSISSNAITTIFEDSKKNIWIGSDDKGLNQFNKANNTFTIYRKQDGLPSNSIYGILEDGSGNLWISTNKGIAKFEVNAKKFKTFTNDDGLVSNEFYSNACLKVKSGEIFFGGNEGFNVFLPDSILENKFLPPVYLTDLKIFNKSVAIGAKGFPLQKSISETQKIVLTNKQSSFTLEFVALNYMHGSQNKYAYILEGLENEWNNVGRKNSASYTYVKPGTYLFKVKGTNNDGVWNNTPTTLTIVVLPPFWKTIWAYIIYFLVFSSLLFMFVRLLMIRAKQAHTLELNLMKLQFFANISHELRTPLSLIVSPLENILSSDKWNKEIKDHLVIIYRNANRLYRLVNEIMDFTKIEDNKLTVSVQSGDIVKFIHEISTSFNDEALRRNIQYQFTANPSSIAAWFDGDKMEKIILNLLSNAFKFTQDNGSISLLIEKLNINNNKGFVKSKNIPDVKELVKISVIDNGKGIPAKDLDKIFDRFYQCKDEDYIHTTGTGIGLALTKSLVELHMGTISVTSEKWKETCFTVLLPLGNTHFKKDEIVLKPIDYSSKVNTFSEQTEQKDTAKVKDDKTLPTILLVEDNFELREYILSELSLQYNVIWANDGVSGLTLATEHIPELIISDIIMPNMTGIELCNQVKMNILTSHIPVVLLTAKTTLEDQIKGIETGADAYITKPFNVRFLEVTIKNLIETRHKLFQRFSQEVYILPKEISNNPIDQDFLGNIITYIEDNIASSELSVENLSTHLLMSPGHTWRKIKSLTGQSTNEFIRTIRLKKAVKLIEENNLNISEIAYKVGFSSPAYFTKCFRQQYGKSPSEYISNFEKKRKQV